MPTPSRVVLLDVDGTVLDYEARLPASAASAVRGAVVAGHRLYLCTGRPRSEITPELWDLGFDGMIGGNGCYVESEGVIIHHQVLDAATVGEAVERLHAEGLEFYLECNHALYGSAGLPEAIAALRPEGLTDANVAWVKECFPTMTWGDLVDAPAEAPWRTDCNKISFVLPVGYDLQPLSDDFRGRASVGTWSLTGSVPEFGEIGQIGVHKGVAVRMLGDHLGVDVADMIGVGDSRSDLEMLQTCGTGVAMGQAPDEVKAAATLVTDPVDEDGLAHAFARLGLLG